MSFPDATFIDQKQREWSFTQAKDKVDLEAQLKNQVSLFEKFKADQETMIKALKETQSCQIEQLKAEQANQIEKLQAEIQVKVNRSQDLEEQLAHAIELAYNRNTREDEMLQKNSNDVKKKCSRNSNY